MTNEKRIVVGVDGSENSIDALRWAIEEANVRNATLEVLNVWHVPTSLTLYMVPEHVDESPFVEQSNATIDDCIGSLGSEIELPKLEKHSIHEISPSYALIEASKGADLLVVGQRGRGGFTGLLIGSVSQQVIHYAACPVVILPSKEAVAKAESEMKAK